MTGIPPDIGVAASGLAVANVQDVIGPAVRGMAADDQDALDRRDDRPRWHADQGASRRERDARGVARRVSGRGSRRGTCRSTGTSRTCAAREPTIPLPMVNLISGGLHAGRQLDLQDVLMIPTGAPDFADAMADVAAVHARLGEMVVAAGQQPLGRGRGRLGAPAGEQP